jgi:hypothetical protein
MLAELVPSRACARTRYRRGSVSHVLDQFEEFVILGKPEQQQLFATLLTDLRAFPIKGLSLLRAVARYLERQRRDLLTRT